MARVSLNVAVKAVKKLPRDTQEVIAQELIMRVADFSRSRMSKAQREEMRRRLQTLATVTTARNDLNAISARSRSFDFLADEPDIYSRADLKRKYA